MPDFSSIAEDNLTDIAQFNPHLRHYLDKERKENIEEELGDTRIMLYEWETNMVTHRAVDIIEDALEEGNDWVVYRIMGRLGFRNWKLDEFILYNAAINGRKKVVDYISKIHNSHPPLVRAAVKLGDLEMLKKLGGEGRGKYFDWYMVASQAAEASLTDIVEYALGNYKWSMDYERLACAAAKGGHRELVFNLLGRVTTDDINYHLLSAAAAEGGHVDLLNELVGLNGDLNYDVIRHAAKGGQRELVQHLIPRLEDFGRYIGTDLLDGVAYSAAEGGYMDIVEDVINGYQKTDGSVVKAGDWELIARGAAASGSTDLLLFTIRHGADNWEDIAKTAALNGYKDIVEAMLVKGVDKSTLYFDMHEDAKLYFGVTGIPSLRRRRRRR